MSELVTPVFLPGGQSLLQDHDFITRLHEGDASIGWLGDERLGVYFADDRLEIWRLCDDGDMRLIMRSKPGHRMLNTDTLRFLAAHDSRAGANAVDMVNKHNDAVMAERMRKSDDRVGGAADKLHWALMKDIGAYEGGSTKRLMTLPAAPWKTKKDNA